MTQPPTMMRTFRSDLVVSDPNVDGKVTISDPIANRHYMVGETTLRVLQHFDGSRDVQELLNTLTGAGVVVSQSTLTSMIKQADGLGFFEEVEANTGPVAAHLRGPSRRSLIFWQILEFDPDRSVKFLAPLGRGLFSRGMLAVLIALFCWSVWAFWRNAGNYINDLQAFGVVSAWIITYVANGLVTALHEYDHALAIGRYGGRVRRMGIALYLFSPAAYTDTSSAWAFKRNSERVVVTLAGVYVESFLFVASVLFWAYGVLPGYLAPANFLIAHVLLARIAFNLNPFLRLDGYWLVSDLLHITNMRAKAFTLLLAVIIPWKYRAKTGFTQPRDERTFLLTYSVASLVTGCATVL